MLKKNNNYKEIAAAYMKLIKPRNKSQPQIHGEESSEPRPLSKITEERRSQQSLNPIDEINEFERAPHSSRKHEGVFSPMKESPFLSKLQSAMSNHPEFSSSMKPNSIQNILKKARSELHFGAAKPQPKTNELLEEVIGEFETKVKSYVQKHADVFIDRFKGELYNIKKKYAELEMSTNENLKKIKLDKEIIDRRAERDNLRSECYKLDQQCYTKQQKLVQIRNSNQELAQEKKFIEEQILNAKANQEKLLRNLDMLKQEFETLQQNEQNKSNALDLNLHHEVNDKSLEVSNMLGMTEIKDIDTRQKEIIEDKHFKSVLADPLNPGNATSVQLYDINQVKEQEAFKRDQEEYFKIVEQNFTERIKLLKKKLENKRKKEMKNLKFIGDDGKHKDPFEVYFDSTHKKMSKSEKKLRLK